jgi:hypothetical protein
MKISQLKFLYVTALTCAALFSISAFADDTFESYDVSSKKYEKFSDWTTKFLCMGVTPTAEEARIKGESLHMSAEQVKNGLDSAIDTDKRSNKLMFHTCMSLYNNSINLVMQASNSYFKGTRILASKMAELMKDFTENTRRHDVDSLWLTLDKMRELNIIIADRIDAESTADNIWKKIPTAQNQGQQIDVKEIRDALQTFSKKEDDPSFLPKGWIQDLLDSKVNPYIVRWNAEANGQQAAHTDNKKLHEILD